TSRSASATGIPRCWKSGRTSSRACDHARKTSPRRKYGATLMKVGFVGTGTMGNPMVRCLIDGGLRVTVHDRRREVTSNLCELGARWADTPRAVAEVSDVVFTSLPGPSQVEEAVLEPSIGLLAALRPGGAYVDMTTNAPGVVRKIADVCRSRGV